MSRVLRILAKALLALVMLIILLVLAALLFLRSEAFRHKAAHYLSERSGREIAIDGPLEFKPGWTPRLIVHQLKIGNADWAKENLMFSADSLDVSVRLVDLLKGRLTLPVLALEKPVLHLEKNAKGKANWDLTQNPAGAVATAPIPEDRGEFPMIGHLRISNGLLSYKDPATKNDITTKIATAGGEAKESIELSGQGRYQGQPFKLAMNGGSVLMLREKEEPYPFHLDTTIGGTSAKLDGTIGDPVKMKDLHVTLTIKGKNAADLFAITGIALPVTPPYQLTGKLEQDGDVWHFRNFKGQLGGSDLKGNIVWHADRKPPYFEGQFVSENLDLADLKGFIGADKEPEDDDRVIPDKPIDISRLTAMDADVTFQGKRVKTPDLLDNFNMKLALKNGNMSLKPVSFGMAGGTINANIDIRGRTSPPRVKADVDFRHLDLHQLFQPLVDKYGKDNVSSGQLGGRIKVDGQGKSLREILATSNGDIGFGMEGGKLSRLLLELVGLDIYKSAGLILTDRDEPVPIRCIVANFDVNDGLMDSKAFLIDTDVTNISGTGQINLKNEGLDLRINVHPKDASLFSARSPLKLTGTFKKPQPGVDAVALGARGGAAVGLSLLTPVAALLAFIEPGLGKDSNCAAYLHEMESSVQKTAPRNP